MDNAPSPLTPVKVDSGFESIQKILMVFIFVLTICMFSYWGYQAVMYILSVSYHSPTDFTPYDMFIGIIAMASSALLFTGSFIWWRKNVNASGFLKFGTVGFIIKDILEIPNALVPLNQAVQVTKPELVRAAEAIGYDLFKIGFWIFALVIFTVAIKKYIESRTIRA